MADGVEATSIYVGQVDYSATPASLAELFGDCGNVKRVTIPTNYNGHPKGFAYVEFGDAGAAEKALGLDGTNFLGRDIKVIPKRVNVPRAEFRGGRGGRGARGRGRGRGRGAYAPQRSWEKGGAIPSGIGGLVTSDDEGDDGGDAAPDANAPQERFSNSRTPWARDTARGILNKRSASASFNAKHGRGNFTEGPKWAKAPSRDGSGGFEVERTPTPNPNHNREPNPNRMGRGPPRGHMGGPPRGHMGQGPPRGTGFGPRGPMGGPRGPMMGGPRGPFMGGPRGNHYAYQPLV